jgi:hypothetical protein
MSSSTKSKILQKRDRVSTNSVPRSPILQGQSFVPTGEILEPAQALLLTDGGVGDFSGVASRFGGGSPPILMGDRSPFEVSSEKVDDGDVRFYTPLTPVNSSTSEPCDASGSFPTCDTCGYVARDGYDMRKHLRRKTPCQCPPVDFTNICPHCGKTGFTKLREVVQHCRQYCKGPKISRDPAGVAGVVSGTALEILTERVNSLACEVNELFARVEAIERLIR